MQVFSVASQIFFPVFFASDNKLFFFFFTHQAIIL